VVFPSNWFCSNMSSIVVGVNTVLQLNDESRSESCINVDAYLQRGFKYREGLNTERV